MIHGDVLGERARLSPDRIALVLAESGRRFTYAELGARVVRCARVMREGLGLSAGDRLAILSGNRVELLDHLLAPGKSGVILVPLSTRLTARELAQVLEDGAVSALVYDGEYAEIVRELRRMVALPTGDGRKVVRAWVALDAERRAYEEDAVFDELAALLEPSDWRRAACGPEDVYCLLYTSGTTGRPKGVVIPHRMLAWNAYNTAVCWQLGEGDVSPLFTPLYHAGGLAAFLLPILAVGGTVVLHQRFDPGEVWRVIERERCTVVMGVPTIHKMLMEAPEFATADVSGLRWLISGGAPLPLYILETFQRRGLVLKQGYGLTEVGVNCFSMTVEESVCKAGSIGRPLMFTETRLVDAEGRDVPDGEVGELWLRGPHVSLGYWRNPEATAAALDPDGWFHTGDLARRDAEGFHTIAGRVKDMLISGGVNVYPAEIEAEILQHPGVEDAAVVGVPHPSWGETGVAFVVARPGQDPTAEALAAFLEPRLARYKIPRELIRVDALPRTPYGKVVKGELREWYLGRGAATGASLLTHRSKGTGEPVLLLNGGMMSMGAWDPVAAILEADFRVIRCDFRGQLLSPGTPPATMAGHAEDVRALLEHLAPGPVHVLAASFGALAGLLLAARHPALVRSLAVITATERVLPESSEAIEAMKAAALQAARGGDGGRVYDLLRDQAFSAAYLEANRESLSARRAQVAALPRAWFEGLAGLLGAMDGLDLRADLRLIRCPALVVGAERDATFPIAHSRALADGIAGARLEVVADSGHALVAEQPARLIGIVREFLAGVRTGAAR